MSPFSKAHTRLAALRADLTGDAFRPEDPGYDNARKVFNSLVDRHPAVIAQCETKADVVHCVRFARDLDLHIAVRAGGHSVAGMSLNDNGLVIDLRRMHTVTVHPGSRTVRVEGGALMSHLDHATRPHGLATTGARDPTTGVAGFVLGGGTGWLDRAFGLAVDNLLGVELVTSDGSRVQATDHENPELFWALHGGGGNFGVATALTLRLHPLPELSIALLTYRPEAGPDVVRTYREIMEAAPPEAGGGVIREQLVDALLTYTGPERDLRELAQPLRALPHEAEILTALPHPELQRVLDSPPGLRNHWSAESLTGLPDEAVDVFCELGNAMPVPTATRHLLFPQGGAIASGPDRYPVPFRDARWTVHPFGMWEDPADDERCGQWVEDVRAAFRPWSSGAVCLNLIGDEGADRVVAGLGAANIRRLAAVKAVHDPDNVFRFNHNIPPL
ncbi:FAD-binding oxidoreductase [Streptomyces sp. NPDC059837]|uniref:FAD-binding oxidoreductase n=1 Tax=unclassified Streptomyces TaxID=2593676 RepID=UPI00225892EF|nr:MULTISPECIES: FAD-binding oxidoreductase [unclassified Streptomyces]MCX4401696.1 FAD-binding oxidoreductase [Streptomyces sp. NBC_01764]MCX5183644.1 FAD-binding oxidoreductase [Streptomyces sp. NBC_00268]